MHIITVMIVIIVIMQVEGREDLQPALASIPSFPVTAMPVAEGRALLSCEGSVRGQGQLEPASRPQLAGARRTLYRSARSQATARYLFFPFFLFRSAWQSHPKPYRLPTGPRQ